MTGRPICPVCARPIMSSQPMCSTHWDMVPEPLQRRVKFNYKHAQWLTQPSKYYTFALNVAVECVFATLMMNEKPDADAMRAAWLAGANVPR